MKLMQTVGIWFLGICLICPSAAGLAADSDYVEIVGSGSINWSQGVIRAKGIGAPPEKYYGKPNARPMAMRAARLDALRNVLEVVNGVRIDSTTLVKDFAIERDLVRTEVQGMVQGAEQVDLEYMSDGTVEVVMQVRMHGGFSQLLLPSDIQQVGSITPVAPASDTPTKSAGVYTGLIVDARGLDARPAMAPKVLDESGQEVYGSAYVSREFAVQQGMSGYAKDVSAARDNERVTDNPLLVKGIRTEGPGRSDIVISNEAANRVRNAAEHLSFMKKCRVMIVVD